MASEDAYDPTDLWSCICDSHIVRPAELPDASTPKPEGHTRFVCISDTHGHHKPGEFDIPDGDVLIHAGDMSRIGKAPDIKSLVKLLAPLPHAHKIVIAGNHDVTFDVESYELSWEQYHSSKQDCHSIRRLLTDHPCITYLQDASCVVNGIKVYGSPWQPVFFAMGFNAPRGEACRAIWDRIPDDTDVLVTHGPPLGYGDLCRSGVRAGCYDLLRAVKERVRPAFHVFGHIHEGYGATTDDTTVFVNAATCSLRYKPTNPPLVFDLPNKTADM